jgi:hypothetical protein
MADTTDDLKIATDEQDFTPPLIAEDIPACDCFIRVANRNELLAFHGVHAQGCARLCRFCLVKNPCPDHRAVNYIFYRNNPLPSIDHQF